MKKAPQINPLTVPEFKMPEKSTLSNGISIYGFPGVYHDITRVDIVYDSGRWTERYPLVAQSVARLFKSGTNSKTAFQMSEAIDHLGSTISVYAGYHAFNITVYAMRKNLQQTLNLLFECLTDDIFPAHEFENYIKNTRAKQSIQEEKTDFLAERACRNVIFGKRHPYGYSSEISFIEELRPEEIVYYFTRQIRNKKPAIYLSGTYDDTEIRMLESIFSDNLSVESSDDVRHIQDTDIRNPIQKIVRKDAVQSSIAMGKKAINKMHPDFAGLSLTNTIFGGFFGSRLMSNIREDKGYTYGIYSSLQTYRYDGAIFIQTETSSEYVTACIKEIETEVKKLQNELITEEELKQARNYLLGKYLSRMDGAFAQMETFKNYQIEGVDIQYFNKFAKIIENTSREEVRDLAQKHLDFDSMYQVIAGK